MAARGALPRYTVYAMRGGMVGYYGLLDKLKGGRVVGVHLTDRERLQRIADDWNRKERR